MIRSPAVNEGWRDGSEVHERGQVDDKDESKESTESTGCIESPSFSFFLQRSRVPVFESCLNAM